MMPFSRNIAFLLHTSWRKLFCPRFHVLWYQWMCARLANCRSKLLQPLYLIELFIPKNEVCDSVLSEQVCKLLKPCCRKEDAGAIHLLSRINCGEENKTSINFEFCHWIWSVVCYYYCLSSSSRTSKIPALNSFCWTYIMAYTAVKKFPREDCC